MCKAGGPRCPKEARRLLNKARAAYKEDPTRENRHEYHERLYQYQLTREGLDNLKAELDNLRTKQDAQLIQQLSDRIKKLEWDRARMSKRKLCQRICDQYVEKMTRRFPDAPQVFEQLKIEGFAFADPKQETVERWMANHSMEGDPIPFTGEQYYAMKNLYRRCAHKELIDGLDAIDIEEPGSQAANYPRDENGRISEVYYASYGSNMNRNRFMAYIQGGKVEGSSRTYDGCKDRTEPKDDIPVKFDNPIFYAMNSNVWSGGIAFMDHSQEGRALGRAYLISSGQFDDVISQESGHKAKGHHVDLDAAVENRVLEDGDRIYGTLVHVGDYNNRPVMTFTSKFTTEDAMYGDMHFASRTGKGRGPRFVGNSPSDSYMRMIGSGLKETFGLSKDEQTTYFLGTYGGNFLSRSTARGHLDPPKPKPAAPKQPEKVRIPASQPALFNAGGKGGDKTPPPF